MTKFQKIQKFSSIVPFWSTFFVVIVTMYELKRRRASLRIWLYFILTFFLSGIAVYMLNAVIMTGQHIFLNVIASGLILAIANILFVDFQILSTQKKNPGNHTTHKMKVVFCCIAIVVTAVGIGVLLVLLLAPSVDIEDINGSENAELAVIGTEDILSTDERYSALSSYILQNGANTEVTGKLKKHDHDEIEFRCQKISGIMILQATKTMYDQLSFEIDSQLETGNLEIVIVIDGQYYDNVAINKTSSITLNDIAGKTVVIKIAAESAKAFIAVKRLVVQGTRGRFSCLLPERLKKSQIGGRQNRPPVSGK